MELNPFKKKTDPAELRAKLDLASIRLEKRELQMKDQVSQSKKEAKEALKNGDERSFRMASKRFGMIQNQANAVGGMVELAGTMRDVVEMQEGIKEIGVLGGALKEYQEELGIDTVQMEKAMVTIQTTMSKVSMASEMISTTMEAVTAGDVEVTSAQDSLKAELMAELAAEQERPKLEEKIKKQRELA